MNISFTGTSLHAASAEVIPYKGKDGLAFKFVCKLDNKGQKDLYDFSPILEEFPYSRDKSKNNFLILDVFNKIGSKKLNDVIKNPRGDHFAINGKVVTNDSNKLYIFRKVQNLLKRIEALKNIEFLVPSEYLISKECVENIMGKGEIANAKLMAKYHDCDNVKVIAKEFKKALGNAIERLEHPKLRI